MTADDAAFLAALPGWAFAVALLIARVGSACMLLPGIGEAELPGTVRAGITLALVAVLLPGVAPLVPPVPAGGVRAGAMVLAEVATGLWLGWLARLVLMALPMAGQFIASISGMANVLQPDPTLGPQTAALSRALGLAAPVVVLASGLHALPIAAVARSYALVPPGAWLPMADSTPHAIAAVTESFALALRIAAPFVLLGTLWQVAMGLLARTVPQLQVYFAALPGQILGSILLLGVLAAALLETWREAADASFAAMPGL